MKRLISHLIAAFTLVFLLCTVAFAAEVPSAVPPTATPDAAASAITPPAPSGEIVITPPAGANVTAPATPSAPSDEIIITPPATEPPKGTITFEDASDPTARDSSSFANPDTSVMEGTAATEPPPEPNRPVGNYSNKYYSSYGREYTRTRDMADELEAYLKLNLPTTAYGGIFKEVVTGKEPFGAWCLNIWVKDKAVIESVLNKYTYEKCTLKFMKADYSLKDFETMHNELIQQEIYKTGTMSISIYQRLNRLSVSVTSSDYDKISALCNYIAKSPFKNAIRFSVQSTPNIDT